MPAAKSMASQDSTPNSGSSSSLPSLMLPRLLTERITRKQMKMENART